jgi:hypothetical protein
MDGRSAKALLRIEGKDSKRAAADIAVAKKHGYDPN